MAQRQLVCVSRVFDWEIDGSHQLCSIHYDHVENLLAIYVPLTCCSRCLQLVQQKPCHVLTCLIMHVRDPQLSLIRKGHCVPVAGFCLPAYSLHMLNRDVNMIQTNKIIIFSKHDESAYLYLGNFKLRGISNYSLSIIVEGCQQLILL